MTQQQIRLLARNVADLAATLIRTDPSVKTELERVFSFQGISGPAGSMPLGAVNGSIPESVLQAGGYLDLARGVVLDRPEGRVRWRLSYWGRREARFTARLFWADRLGQPSVHLLDLAMAWPKILRQATTLADYAKWFNQVRWRFRRTLGPFGFDLQKAGVLAWRLCRPEEPKAPGWTISLDRAADHLREAQAHLAGGATEKALAALGDTLVIDPDCLPALLAAGHLVLGKGVAADKAFIARAAKALLEHRRTLTAAIEAVTACPRTMDRQGKWESVTEVLHRIENERAALESLFAAAESFLQTSFYKE